MLGSAPDFLRIGGIAANLTKIVIFLMEMKKWITVIIFENREGSQAFMRGISAGLSLLFYLFIFLKKKRGV